MFLASEFCYITKRINVKEKEAEKRHLDIAKEAKHLEKLSKTKKAAPPKNQ